MFNSKTYIERRKQLKKEFKTGILLFLGNNTSTRNINCYIHPFRQNSSFLYYFGLNYPNLDAVIDIDNDKEILFGPELTIDDIIWDGPSLSLEEKANVSGVTNYKELEDITSYLKDKKNIKYLTPYDLSHYLKLNNYLNLDTIEAKKNLSVDFIKAVAKQRNIKEEQEIVEIEDSINFTKKMMLNCYKMAKPGIVENELLSEILKISNLNNYSFSFNPIINSKSGAIHSFNTKNKLEKSSLLTIDLGFEGDKFYSSDITRTICVGSKFNSVQKDIYNIVLNAQVECISMMKPELNYIDVYYHASRIIFNGLKDLGFCKGDTEAAIIQGVHGLFFCHGLGHLIGLDAHDLEDLGENYIGYDETILRSSIFGIKFQRFAKKLEPGMVLTVEPGIYFMKELIKKWQSKALFKDYINYDIINKYIDFGGIRIEDDVLITNNAAKILGKPIPKTVEELDSFI